MAATVPAPVSPSPGRRHWPVRSILFGIVFALVLPGLAFSAFLLNRIASSEQVRFQEAAHSAALRAADALDHELAVLASAMLALSGSPTLDRGDIDAFAIQAQAVALSLGHDVVLADSAGQQLFSTIRPAARSSALPGLGAKDALAEALRTRMPATSNLYIGTSRHQRRLAVVVPRIVGNQIMGVLAVSMEPDAIATILATQNLPPGWSIRMVDGTGEPIANAPEPPGTAPMIDQAGLLARLGEPSANWMGTTPQGLPVMNALERSHRSSWSIVVAVPRRVVEAPLHNTVMLLAASGATAMLIAALLAWRLANSVRLPLQRLAEAGDALRRGEPVLGVRSAIAEVDAVSRALLRASRELRARSDALSAERARLETVFETVPIGIVIAQAPSGRIVASNGFAQRLVPDFSAIGELPQAAHFADGSHVPRAACPLRQVLDGARQAELQCLIPREEGGALWVQLVAAPILSAGVRTGVVVAVLDIDDTLKARETLARSAEQLESQVAERTAELTDANTRLRDEIAARAQAEEQLRQSQKMEAVGQLTGGIAHDFNNLLTIVMGSLDLLRRRATDDRSRRLIDNALAGSTRAATLTARLLAFSRRQPLLPQALDVNTLVRSMTELLGRTLGKGIEMQTVLAPDLWPTHADPNQLENALINLAVNARDAMRAEPSPEGDGPASTLTIITGNTTLAPGALVNDPDVTPGDYVRIAVADTGTGMPPDIAARVFEPFYTTKPVGKGTGLGLSQVHGFVKQSGGHVVLRTSPGDGTIVSLYLPRLQAETDLVAVPALPGPTPSATASLVVLLVEDEAAVRSTSAEALRELGHTVLEAASGPAALLTLEAHIEIDLLLTDVMLPLVNGPRLAEQARQRRPGLPVLFTSGFTGESASGTLLPAGAPLLLKPFTLEQLASMLQRCLRGGG